jgi:hypothetical protein
VQNPPDLKERRAILSTTNSTITVKVGDPASRDRQLEQAISLLREKATGYGILLTRIDYTTFTITLSPEVAYGQTREVDLL